MFSRGNISEKSRILSMPSVSEAVERGRQNGEKCAAVDLFAGIGYFAFCYLKAGVSVCLCWEINGWSVEGLRRGAQANKWESKIIALESQEVGSSDEQLTKSMEGEETRLLVFPESNIHAVERVRQIKHRIPPIRHVNCGFLPSSQHSWRTALEVLDPVEGGWLHLHENIAAKDIQQRSREILEQVRWLANCSLDREGASENGVSRTLDLQDVAQVKTFAPGVMHCVLDIFLHPTPLSQLATRDDRSVRSSVSLEEAMVHE
ncbi:MAG: hypothetical protein M1821_000925 [Bathelium mastoideum]|nr:MAG: hypothetical protein M1821_000925 [Bathelium mastoideum]KAI9694052.1 MAG: hypothetical protein M1822_003323 [Bathelium mastoideum]